MILAINAGNSIIHAGLYDKDGQCAKALFSSRKFVTSYEHSYKLLSFLQSAGCEASQVKGAIISHVNPISGASIAEAVRMTCGVAPMYVGPGIRTGIDIMLKDPASMGADLVAMSVAALNKHEPPIIVVIIGATVLVKFAINEKGRYMGGTIAPSPQLALSALCESAASLPAMAIEAPVRLIGTDTKEAVSSGVVYGTAAMIRGMVEMMIDKIAERPHNNRVKVIITGSVAPAIMPYIGIEAEQDDDLLLDGLNILYHRNRRKQG
ncbi:MAG: type III pantothenate kinase [Defluviitaleaceae bacterium]|nr:type III pantothenate kinase [Defluviitaleaceae bacterium]